MSQRDPRPWTAEPMWEAWDGREPDWHVVAADGTVVATDLKKDDAIAIALSGELADLLHRICQGHPLEAIYRDAHALMARYEETPWERRAREDAVADARDWE